MRQQNTKAALCYANKCPKYETVETNITYITLVLIFHYEYAWYCFACIVR